MYAKLTAPPFNMKNVKNLANYCVDRCEFKTLICQSDQCKGIFKDRGDLLSKMRQAWRDAEAYTKRVTNRASDGFPEQQLSC